MANPVVRGFQGLTRFSGRDGRGQFWPYAGVVIVLVFLVSGVAMGWVMSGVFVEMQQFAAEHPETVTVQSSPGSYSVQIDAGHPEAPIPNFTAFFGVLGLMVAAAVGLLAAAISRRLHDSGLSAFWGLLPLPFLLFALTAFPMMMADFSANSEPDLGLFFAIFLNNLAYMAALVTLIVLLARRGAGVANRYGEAPVPG